MLKGILAISGQSGLFKLVSEGKNSIIVESLLTGKRMPAYSTARISALEEIAIFTEAGEVALKKVLKLIKDAKNSEPLQKMTNDEMINLFTQILPDYDRDKVYSSDMKKVFQWYNILLDKNILDYKIEEEDNKE